MAKNQSQPGEIKDFNVKADGVDITSMVMSLDLYQDLFMPTWSCTVTFSDTQNLLMNIPIKPGTDIEIKLETDYPENKSKVFKFSVYKISDRVQIKQEHQGYILNCVTKEFFINQKTRISKSFKTSSPPSMVSIIVDQFGLGEMSELDSDPTVYSAIVPNMSPFAAINWISRFTVGTSGGADFLFYQSDHGEFKYKSLDKMFTDRSGIKFKQLNPNTFDKSSNVPDENFLNIENYEFLTQHDSLNNFAAGYYGNSTVSHDMYTKAIKRNQFNYGDDIPLDAEKKPFDGPYFDNANDSHFVYQPVSLNGMGNGITLPADTHESWLGSRKTNVMKLEENRLVMTVPGAVSHYELLGKQVDVELPSQQDADDGQYLDKYLKGSYVVAAIRHHVTTTEYKCVLELGKKRLDKAYE